jgi:hypothetical protein
MDYPSLDRRLRDMKKASIAGLRYLNKLEIKLLLLQLL